MYTAITGSPTNTPPRIAIGIICGITQRNERRYANQL